MEDVDLVYALRSNPIVRQYIMQPLFTEQAEAIAHINKLENFLAELILLAVLKTTRPQPL